ncbi:MAG: glycosyltransferase [Prolixibacteraceae bacterium]|nr:glycosyltransferase [Prolixibacteraceae bacterium]
MKTFIKLFFISVVNLKGLFRKVSIKKLKVLIRALKNEPASQIIENFKNYLNINSKSDTDSLRKIKTREEILLEKNQRLTEYFIANKQISFTETNPELSIILVLYNKAELTLACLESLVKSEYQKFEIIIVDNNSSDKTKELLETISGAKIILNDSNLHFLRANNQAIELVKGKYLLFLNNDTELPEKTITRVINTIKSIPECGAVGAKIILPEGVLQEAGSIIWNDGSCLGYGRLDNPELPQYNFARSTDYCSGAFLLTKTELFKKHGGFDTIFEPAYYEETDYCLWLQNEGYKVIYDPKVEIKHFEFGSGVSEKAIELHKINQEKFFNKHSEILKKHFNPDLKNILKARFSEKNSNKKNILYIDDRVPHIEFGSGFPRSNYILNSIVESGNNVTVYPINFPNEDNWDNTYRDINPFIEIAIGFGINRFEEFINERKNYYDIIWISRPHNFTSVEKYLSRLKKGIRIIYDAEAIFSQREINKKTIKGAIISEYEKEALIKKEVELAHKADLVISVSKRDAEIFENKGVKNVEILGHCLKIETKSTPFNERKGLLFVGNLDYNDSPNVDSIMWFINDIWPQVKIAIPDISMDIIGSAESSLIKKIKTNGILIHGKIENINPYYQKNRLFIAPTRFAAGIPYKIHESAANGLPSVVTKILSDQLDWTNNQEIWSVNINADEFAKKIISAYNNQDEWEQVQSKMLFKIRKEMSEEKYKLNINKILEN